jgi:hypothetical protein
MAPFATRLKNEKLALLKALKEVATVHIAAGFPKKVKANLFGETLLILCHMFNGMLS